MRDLLLQKPETTVRHAMSRRLGEFIDFCRINFPVFLRILLSDGRDRFTLASEMCTSTRLYSVTSQKVVDEYLLNMWRGMFESNCSHRIYVNLVLLKLTKAPASKKSNLHA
jgi:hypothetical protein